MVRKGGEGEQQLGGGFKVGIDRRTRGRGRGKGRGRWAGVRGGDRGMVQEDGGEEGRGRRVNGGRGPRR